MSARHHDPVRTRAVGAIAGLAVALVASTASANGRFPRAQRLIQDAVNPEVMALYGTYGLLVTRDGGASWRHVCEAATGAYAGEDSLLEVMADERIVLRTDTGLARSDASLCGYDAVLNDPGDALQDITRDSASPNGILALTTRLGDDGVFVSSLSASTDGGASFTPLAAVAPQTIELGLTLDVGASQPGLIYLSGFDDQGRATLAKSTDRGQSFEGLPITGLGIADPPYIAAISALDPDRVFVRTDVFTLPNGDFEARETADDSLYFTPDGGQTWHLALNKRGKLYGFALSPDERWVLAGFGDPVLPAIFVEPDELGLYRVALEDLVASPDDPPWERIYAGGVTCLRWTEQALFACVVQEESGFELGRAPDANFSLADAAPFEPLLRLPAVLPLECPAETAGAACLVDEITGWQATCNVLRASCSLDAGGGAAGSSGAPGVGPGDGGGAGEATMAPTGPAPSGGGGASSAAGAGGAAGEATGAGTGDGGAGQLGEAGGPRKDSGSCAVSAAPGRGLDGHARVGWLGALVALVVLAARRRACLLVLAALGAWGCGDGATPDETSGSAGAPLEPGPRAPADCGGDGDDFALGMSKTTASGAITVAVVAAEPAPPLVGANSWTVQLSREGGEALPAARVSLTGWMPDHGHGLNAVPLIEELDGGRYQIQPIILYMPQLWELSVVVDRDEGRDVATFDVCVP